MPTPHINGGGSLSPVPPKDKVRLPVIGPDVLDTRARAPVPVAPAPSVLTPDVHGRMLTPEQHAYATRQAELRKAGQLPHQIAERKRSPAPVVPVPTPVVPDPLAPRRLTPLPTPFPIPDPPLVLDPVLEPPVTRSGAGLPFSPHPSIALDPVLDSPVSPRPSIVLDPVLDPPVPTAVTPIVPWRRAGDPNHGQNVFNPRTGEIRTVDATTASSLFRLGWESPTIDQLRQTGAFPWLHLPDPPRIDPDPAPSPVVDPDPAPGPRADPVVAQIFSPMGYDHIQWSSIAPDMDEEEFDRFVRPVVGRPVRSPIRVQRGPGARGVRGLR